MQKTEVPDYGIKIEDEVPDYGLVNLFDEGTPPDGQKQVVPKPPSYEESLTHVLEGKKQIYVDPQYSPEELPPEYEDDDDTDYTFEEGDRVDEILDDMNVSDYDDVEKQLGREDMTPSKARIYLNVKVLKDAVFTRNQFKGFKAQASVAFKNDQINEATKTM